MPLSEQEQRLLDEMERNLHLSDADFVATVGAARGRPNYRGIVIGAILVLAGIAALIVGVTLSQPVVGVIGFAVMFAGVLLAVTPSKSSSVSEPRTSSEPRAARTGGGFMDSLGDRWERRQGGREG